MNDPDFVVAIVLGIPAIGFSIRLVVKPIVDGIVRARELNTAAAAPPRPQPPDASRLAELEAEVARLRDEVARHAAVESFYTELRNTPRAALGSAGPANPAGPPPPPG